MTIYERLREIGVSVESADAVALAMNEMSARKIDAFIWWLQNCNYREAAYKYGFSLRTMQKIVKKIKNGYTKYQNIRISMGDE